LNRVLTDQVSQLLFVHSPEAGENLAREGIDPARVHFTGNTMMDSLVRLLDLATHDRLRRHEVEPPYLLVTLHRPALVDTGLLCEAMAELDAVADELPVVFPVHPRTRARIDAGPRRPGAARLLPPVGYLEFLALQRHAMGVLTDSGGVQEETTFLGVPCFTLRDNTERPVTITQGTNTLLGLAPERIGELPALLGRPRRPGAGVPQGWDGHAAERVAAVLRDAA
ncbi:MAG TPA: UDP-N-acetylglucosamine 2-epimerase, partial [Solirubrobacteraceae bacterium]|nr:UDP-N-acetylglucosamine 2-epimerase [Solirubrobacteraceae bacterium]